MDHWVKVSAAQPDDLSLVSETHIVEEESWLPTVVLCFSHYAISDSHKSNSKN